jgi:hypothetical protein
MESKLLKGGKPVLDRTKEQEAALKQKEQDLQAQRAKEEFVVMHNTIGRIRSTAGATRVSFGGVFSYFIADT